MTLNKASYRRSILLTACIYLVLSSNNPVFAACNNYLPGSGESILCDSSGVQPDSTAIFSADGVTGITVSITHGSEISPSGTAAISLGGSSNITNAGILTGTTGALLREGSSLLDNSGTITGTSGPGIQFNGNGNNQLKNNGTISGSAGSNAIIFGAGDDTLIVTGGTINGNIEQSDGADRAYISNGSVAGTLSQGDDIDDFAMSGGTLENLRQGNGLDTFTMTGGTITGAFEDGDIARMSGGTIGRVNMKLDDNFFDMSGGEIIGNLVTGFGKDTILVRGNSIIGGNISVSDDNDSITMTGGTVRGEIRMSGGDDIFHWEAGNILSSVLMGADNDRIEFTHLDTASAASSPMIDGGTGDDLLIMNDSQYIHSNTSILQGIERVNLTDNSTLTLNNRLLPLGDARDDNSATGFSIDSTSMLAVRSSSAIVFNSHLSGVGTISTDTAGNAFNFTSNNASDNFGGTLALGHSTLDLSGQNSQALSQATLKAGTDSVTTVGNGTQHIGGLVFSGGIVDFGNVAPGDTLSNNIIQTRNDLNLNGSGTIRVGIGNMLHEHPVAAGHVPLLSQDDKNTTIKLAGSDGTVAGSGGSLTLTDASNNIITDSVGKDIIQNGTIAAHGTWDWRLTSGENQDGLYIAWALKQVNLLGTGDNALRLDAEGATGNAADLSAKVTGSGDIAIEDSSGSTVSLSNQGNNYFGVTDVRRGNLLMRNDHVLGNTSLLQMAGGTTLNMNSYAQTIGSVNTAEDSTIDINGGSLTVDHGGVINGHLQGVGNLTLIRDTLDINGANTSLSASTHILSGATVNLNNTAGLGSGSINHEGLLNVSNTSGLLRNSLNNNGAVNVNTAQVVLSGNNTRFSGTFNIDNNSQLTAGEAKHLGSASINDAGTLNLSTDSNWALNNSVTGNGNLHKEGAGVVTLTQKSAAYTGETVINGGGIAFGSRGNPLTLSTSGVNINNGFLAGNGTVSGDVNNHDLLQVGNNDNLPQSTTAITDSLTIGGNLTNAGRIQVGQTGSAVRAGNTLNIKGNYTGKGGKIAFNTKLGDDKSVTDHMSVKGNTSGITYVNVTNAGGAGATTYNGIELINVSGNSVGQFLQDGRIVAGAYDYRLARGTSDNQKNWYLTNTVDFPAVPPSPPVMSRPEFGSYIANLAAANTMFITRLHDRLGETQYIDLLTGEKRVTSLWLRQVGTHNSWRSDSGALKTTSNQYIVMAGGDIAQWSSSGLDRGHFGLMVGYGNHHNKTHSGYTGYSSRGRVNGYNLGLYGTWYANDVNKAGLYLDSWVQYSWFRNTVNGEDLPEEKYNSRGLSASLESGYTWKIGEFYSRRKNLNSVYIRPVAQITWTDIEAKEHIEHNGTRVSSDGDGNIQTRLGTRVFLNGYNEADEEKYREFEPFVEVNWLHNTHSYSSRMNGEKISQEGTQNLGEVKAGVEGQLSRHLKIWGNAGQQIGDKGYNNTEVMLGVNYSW